MVGGPAAAGPAVNPRVVERLQINCLHALGHNDFLTSQRGIEGSKRMRSDIFDAVADRHRRHMRAPVKGIALDSLHRARHIDLRKGEHRCVRNIELGHAAIGESTIVDSLNRGRQRCHHVVVKLFAALKGLLGNRGKGRVVGPGHRVKCLASVKRIPAQLLNRIGQCDFLDAASAQAAHLADMRIAGKGNRRERGTPHTRQAHDILAIDSRGHLQRRDARVAILDRNFVGEVID